MNGARDVRNARVLLVVALLVAAAAGVLLRDTPGYAVRVDEQHLEGDIDHYVYWTRLVTLDGVQGAYAGTWPETYAVYPPVTLYGYQVAGELYRALVDPSFDIARAQASAWLRAAIKLEAVGWHLLATLGLYIVGRRVAGSDSRAAVAATFFAADPALLYDVAHWGQPDGAHSLFSVLAVGWIGFGHIGRGWVAMVLAALAKPQAWSILPLAFLGSVRTSGMRELARGVGFGVVVAVVVLLPFLLTNRLSEFLTLPGTISSVLPAITANAHNLWWLVLAVQHVDPLQTKDTALLLGPFSYRVVAGVLVAVQYLVTYWLYWTRRATLAEAAALGVLGWFVFTTQAHENHLVFALPLLALAWPSRPSLLVVFGVLSVTVLLNMLLQDQLVLEALGSGLYSPIVMRLRSANAVLNVVTLAAWAGWAASRQPGTAPTGRVSRPVSIGEARSTERSPA